MSKFRTGYIGKFIRDDLSNGDRIEQTLQLPTHWKSHTAFPLTYLHLTLTHSKDQGQGHTHFDYESHKRMADGTNIAIADSLEAARRLRLTYVHLTLAHSKGQGQGDT